MSAGFQIPGEGSVIAPAACPAFLWGGLVVILSQPLRLVIGGTAAWLAFAGWLTR